MSGKNIKIKGLFTQYYNFRIVLVLLTIFVIFNVYFYSDKNQFNYKYETFGQEQNVSNFDKMPPSIMVPENLTIEATGPNGSIVNFEAKAYDNTNGNLSNEQISCKPSSGTVFHIGLTKVKCKATDSYGNTGKKTFLVTVNDTIAPETFIIYAQSTLIDNVTNKQLIPSDDIHFRFTGKDRVGIKDFECKIDNKNWVKSHKANYTEESSYCTFFDLPDGEHQFQVRAWDTSENEDLSPDIFNFTIISPINSLQEIIDSIKSERIVPLISQNFTISYLNKTINMINDDYPNNDLIICNRMDFFSNIILHDKLNGIFDLSNTTKLLSKVIMIKENFGCPSPFVDAGKDIEVEEDTKNVILNGTSISGIYDNLENLIFSWKQENHTLDNDYRVDVKDSDKLIAYFDAPDIDEDKILSFQLKVTNRNGLSSIDTKNVKIKNNDKSINAIDYYNDYEDKKNHGSNYKDYFWKNDDLDTVDYSDPYKGFNFGAVGDFGCNSNTQETIKNILGKEVELFLALGDFSYKKDGNCWLDIINPIRDKTKIIIGNHDTSPSPLLNQYINNFHMNKKYYSFNYQKIHFLVISTEDDYEKGSEQYDFVVNDLKKSSIDPDVNWILVSQHKASYTSPSSVSGESNLRDTYHRLFDQYGVDLVLQGHLHNYQRTYPIMYNQYDSLNPIVTDNNKNTYFNPPGAIFLIVGSGGINSHTLKNKEPFVVYQQDSDFGFLNINIKESGRILEGKFYSNSGVVLDKFIISKETGKADSNKPPRAEDDFYQSISNKKLVLRHLLDNDADPNLNDDLSISAIQSDTDKGGFAVLNTNKKIITYYPPKNYIGTDRFEYTITDENGASDSGTVIIDIKDRNKSPKAQNMAFSIITSHEQIIQLKGSDQDENDIF